MDLALLAFAVLLFIVSVISSYEPSIFEITKWAIECLVAMGRAEERPFTAGVSKLNGRNSRKVLHASFACATLPSGLILFFNLFGLLIISAPSQFFSRGLSRNLSKSYLL